MRLEKAVGSDRANSILQKLSLYTREITKDLNAEKAVYYADAINNNDHWDNMRYEKHLQTGSNIGERMQNAFADAFAAGKERVIIIYADCLELETHMIKEAFAVLNNNDVVIGPSRGGGYYLIGSRKFLPTLFENRIWEDMDVLMDTILDLKKMGAQYYLMKTLNDIATARDLNNLDKFIAQKPEDWF